MVGTLSSTRRTVADKDIRPLSAFPKAKYQPNSTLLAQQSQMLARRVVGLKEQTILEQRCQEAQELLEERARRLIQDYQQGVIDLKTFKQHKKELLASAAVIGFSLLILTNFNPKVQVRDRTLQSFSPTPKTEVVNTSSTTQAKVRLSSVAKANRAAILKVIRFAEGTADPRGYNRIFGGQEVEDLSRHPDICVKFRKTCSTAAGAYQFLTTTWEELKLGEFTPENQDKGAIALIRRRGALADVEAGRFEDAIAKLSPEWASLPRWDGDTRGTYDQPVKTMSELRRVFLEHGGQLAKNTQPAITVSSEAKKTYPTKTGVGNLILSFFQPHKAQAQASSTVSAAKLIAYMERQGYEISRNPGEVNIIHIRNGSTARDLFEDKRIVLQFINGVPRITGEWTETTKPGLTIVRQPINSKGAIAIAPGQYKAWQVGTHVGGSGRHAHEALIQTGGSITGYRDSDRNGTFETIDRGFFGVNIHAPWGNSDRVEDRSAGCMVTASKADHKAFMKLVKNDPRFLANPNFVFAATVIDGEKL